MSDGELFIIGRIKDLLIVDGRNHYPDDIEATIQEITGGRVAAISVPDDRTEQLVAIVELKKRGGSDEEALHKLRTIKREVASAISQSHSVRVADLVLVPPGSIPITTSGKVRRSACVERYRQEEFTRLDVPHDGACDEAELRHWLVDYLVTNIGCSPDDIDLDASLNDLGVGSRDAVVLSGELSELLGRPVSPVEFWQHPTINALAAFLTDARNRIRSRCGARPPRPGSLDEPIAVIGLGCRFPGGIHGPESLWQFLCDGRSAVAEVPPDRWSPFDDGSPEVAAALARTTRWGSFLSEIDAFDAEFFEISPSEAAKIDPQQRLLLEVAYEALEHAGIPADSLRRYADRGFRRCMRGRVRISGVHRSESSRRVVWHRRCAEHHRQSASRISLILRGPSVTVDTACSSSLVAVHLACQSLRTGDSNLAIAAGVNLLLSPAVTRSFDQAEAMSPTGQLSRIRRERGRFRAR